MNAVRFIAAALCLFSLSAKAEIAWPTPSMPRGTELESAGDEIHINGIPTRIFVFTSRQSVDRVVGYFRQQAERDFTTVPAKDLPPGATAVGGRHGDFWLTLKAQPQGRGTKGTWSATPRFMPGMKQPVVTPTGFPGSAKLVQQIDSFDAGKSSQMAIGIDAAPVDGVAQRLEEDMRDNGFRKQALPAVNWPASDHYVAVFSKAREEVWVSLRQERVGTAITLNRISALESLQ